MSFLYQAKTLASYYLNAINQHSLHAPFIYTLYTKVIKESTMLNFPEIESIRATHANDHRMLTIKDLGAGSRISKTNHRKVSEITKNSLSSKKYSQLYYNLIVNYNLKDVIELGTSLGINTLYLSQNPSVNVTTFEGCPSIAHIARESFRLTNRKNVTLVEGNIDDKLPDLLEKYPKVDLVYFDANHRKAPTLSYFQQCLSKKHNNSIFIFDDIHWSAEMEQAWQQIINHEEVTLSIDLYKSGLIFFDKNLKKQHYILEF